MMTDLPRCRQFLEQGITQGLHIGAQVCVSHRGQIVAEFSVGRAREGRPLRPEHRILWMSAGKPLTAIAIAQLWEQGRVAPGDPVAQHIPEFASHAHGPVTSREDFARRLSSSRALVHVWPTRHAHPIDFTGLPVVRLGSANSLPPTTGAPPLSGAILRKTLLEI